MRLEQLKFKTLSFKRSWLHELKLTAYNNVTATVIYSKCKVLNVYKSFAIRKTLITIDGHGNPHEPNNNNHNLVGP